ncbi:MAG: 23S rRNA (guanosine(2251)-2'-O)-methyltransferase RlmB [Alphaproteobacteria bacterium]
MSAQVLIFGRHAVISALKNKDRKVSKILVTKDNLAELSFVEKNKVQVVDRKEIEKHVGKDAVHQGFLLFAEALNVFSLEDVIDICENKPNARVLILDQVTDPQNVGAIIRSCVAFGVDALIVQDKNTPQENGTIIKASAGTYEYIKIARVTNLSRAIEALQKNSFWVIGMDGYAKTTLKDFKPTGKIAIVMGSEGKGMRRLVEENCDEMIRLETSDKVESLNVSVATSIVLYNLQ